jgi:putative transposase
VRDITYLKVGAISRYLAVVMDKYSRCVVGWSYGRSKDVALTLRALNSAVRRRRPRRGLVFHTDRGTEYAGTAFKERLAELGFIQSMNRPGVELRAALKSYVPFYNQDRLHSSLQYVPPATFEQQARRTGCQ